MARTVILLRTISTVALLLVPVLACAQGRVQKDAVRPQPAADEHPLEHTPRATTAAITVTDLMTRLYIFADDSMLGRDSREIGGLKGTEYIAGELRRMGMQPAGENGTYFQNVLHEVVLSDRARIVVNGQTVASSEFLARPQFDLAPRVRDIDGAEVVYGGVFGDMPNMIDPARTAGKVVVFTVAPAADGTPQWQANRGLLSQRYSSAAAVAVATLDPMPEEVRVALAAPGAKLRAAAGSPAAEATAPSFLYTSGALTRTLLGADPAQLHVGATGRTVGGTLAFEERPGSARNVIGVIPGSDPALRGQYVVIGSHSDHVGRTPEPVDHDSLRAYLTVARPGGADAPERAPSAAEQVRINAIRDSLRALRPARLDSVYNGADDDGSGSMAMLEIAEAYMAAGATPRRSLLFIWHTAEELGLFGSQYFSDHPTVPRDSMVAMLNMDMIGRGGAADGKGPDYLELIGSRRLSTELGDLVEAVNSQQPNPLRFNYEYDANNHPQQYYCRSDHYMYARYGIPVVFFSSGGHRDYHMLTDEPQYIEYAKLARVTRLIHDVLGRVANLDRRVRVDGPLPDPQGQCRQ